MFWVYSLPSSGDSHIRRLNLSGNNIGDKGATLLAEMLKVRVMHTQWPYATQRRLVCRIYQQPV